MTDLKVEQWGDLDPFDLEELRKQYKDQFVPWFSAFTQALKIAQNPKEEKDKENDDADSQE